MENTEKNKKYISVIFFSLFVIMFVVCYSMVGKATNNIDELESQKQENEENESSYKEQASELSESKTSLEILVSSLNSELSVIYEEISDIETQIEEKKAQIEVTRQEIIDAEEVAKQQYEDMKIRIKFMYESGSDNYLDAFLSGNSIAEGLNKAEYVSRLVSYDRQMLERYKETKNTIEIRQQALISEQSELEQLMVDISDKRALVLQKIESTNAQIVSLTSEIDEAEEQAIKYERQAAANQMAINDESRRIEEESILARQREEQASREQASREQASREQASREQAGREESGETGGGEEETTVPPENNGGGIYDPEGYTPAEKDLDMLAALIECEAGDQSYYGMLCVGAVVMNRIKSSSFPNTLVEVLYQPYQFSPVTASSTGFFQRVYERGANETCYKAAREVLIDGHIVGTWLFFRMNDGSREGEVIGDHVFY